MHLVHVTVERNLRNVVLEKEFMIKKHTKFNRGCVLTPFIK